jgi:hypothetical protein
MKISLLSQYPGFQQEVRWFQEKIIYKNVPKTLNKMSLWIFKLIFENRTSSLAHVYSRVYRMYERPYLCVCKHKFCPNIYISFVLTELCLRECYFVKFKKSFISWTKTFSWPSLVTCAIMLYKVMSEHMMYEVWIQSNANV